MATIKYPETSYTITNIGPSREYSFNGNDGNKVTMKAYSVQFEGVAEWVDISQKPDADEPVVGQVIEGHIEDNGQYGMKFVKKRSGGSWSGGKGSAGAAWANAVQTTAVLVAEYYKLTGTKPAKFDEMLERVEKAAPAVKSMIDKFAGTATTEEKKDDAAAAPAKTEAKSKAVHVPIDEKELDNEDDW